MITFFHKVHLLGLSKAFSHISWTSSPDGDCTEMVQLSSLDSVKWKLVVVYGESQYFISWREKKVSFSILTSATIILIFITVTSMLFLSPAVNIALLVFLRVLKQGDLHWKWVKWSHLTGGFIFSFLIVVQNWTKTLCSRRDLGEM